MCMPMHVCIHTYVEDKEQPKSSKAIQLVFWDRNSHCLDLIEEVRRAGHPGAVISSHALLCAGYWAQVLMLVQQAF